MKLNEAIELIWENRKYDADSATEAVSHLNEEVAESLKALLKNDKKKAQDELEDAFSCLFIALKVMNINPEDVIKRQIKRMKNEPNRIMNVYSDRVEIIVDKEVKGGWNIWTPEDLDDAQQMAKEFKCKIIWKEATQLQLTEMLKEHKDVQR